MDLLVDAINRQANLTEAEQVQMNEFLIEFKRAVTEGGAEKESKIKQVLLGGLNVGSKVALPLFVEYIKYEARQHGMQI